jgi:hypothetical protein
MNRNRKAPLLPLLNVSSDATSDGTGRLDIEYARSRMNALASQAELLTAELIRVKTDVLKLLDELDTQPTTDRTEPGICTSHRS